VPWAKFDDRFPSNRKVRLLSDGAFRLYVSAICWSAENLTDGVIKAEELRLVADVRAARTRAKELVSHGLWEEISNVGWCIHDYHEYQPTADQARQAKKAKAARQKRWRDGIRGDDDDSEGAHVDASRDALRDASGDGGGDAAPTRPDPYPSFVGTGGRSSNPQRKTAAHPSLRSGRLPSEPQADRHRPEDPLPVVRTATIPGGERDHVRREKSADELRREREIHNQGCAYCQRGPRVCDTAADLVRLWMRALNREAS